jgi:hypothetical protein
VSQVAIFSIEPLCPACGRVMHTAPADDHAVRSAVCLGETCPQRGQPFVYIQPTVVLLRAGGAQVTEGEERGSATGS